MGDVLWLAWLYCGYFLTVAASGFFLCRLCAPFVRLRQGRFWKALLFLTLAGTSGMVIWIGDPNLLYTLPVFFALFFLATRGDRVGRLAVCMILFCLEMSVCALLDSYVQLLNDHGLYNLYDVVTRLARPLVFGALWLALRRRLPREPVVLSRRLWKLVLGLAAMPLCALIAVVLLTFRKYDSAEVNTLAMNQGMVVLPFVLVTSLVLLLAILILADHERLEQAGRLAGLREVYYQGLRQQETQVRRLRHDLRNHLTAVRGLLERGDAQGAIGYLDQIAGSPALRGGRRVCENEAANAVLSAKAEAMEREGVTADLAVSLPKNLPVADVDLCALLGNALDNAIEGSRGGTDRNITVRCKADKGLLMLRVENTLGGEVKPDLATTKADKAAHGFGIPGRGGSSWWCACRSEPCARGACAGIWMLVSSTVQGRGGDVPVKYPTRLSDAVHILAFIALHPEEGLTSERIAGSIRTNPGYVRQLMSALRKGGLLTSVRGHPRPALARAPWQITLLDVYRAVEGDKPLLHQDTHTNPACGEGVHIQLALGDCYVMVQRRAEEAMRSITLQEVLDRCRERAGLPEEDGL